jgi:hypothetical protein
VAGKHDRFAIVESLWCEILRRNARLQAIDDLLPTAKSNLAGLSCGIEFPTKRADG